MKQLSFFFGLILFALVSSCQSNETLRSRVEKIALLPHQGISVETLLHQLIIINSVSPAALQNKDSLESDASDISFRLLRDVDTSKEAVKEFSIFYLNKYIGSPTAGVAYGVSVSGNSIYELSPNLHTNDIDTVLLQRASAFRLAADEHFRIKKGADFTLFKNVGLDTLLLKRDSLLKVSHQVIRRLVEEVIGANCKDFSEVSFCLLDQRNMRRMLLWRYVMNHGAIADTAIVVDLSAR